MAHDSLPVGENLIRRRIVDSAVCPHYGAPESTAHLFFSCPYAAGIWARAPLAVCLNLNIVNSIGRTITALNKLNCLPPSGITGPLAPWILWAIWSARNQLIFKKISIPGYDSLTLAIIGAKEWHEAQGMTHGSAPPTRNQPCGIKPPPDTVTIHTDAAWMDSGQAGLGWIFTDSQNRTCSTGSMACRHVRSPLMAEALATLTAVRVATESGLSNVLFASDSLILVKALNLVLPSKELHGILHDILELSSNFSSCFFTFISRELNRRDDTLAKDALFLVRNSG
ncbi:hypothetical protein CARUB_v10018494mg [Capsella rubella]|uniref:RNase H type-1 domain-containing protein n=1 Tax=Capsella rubella TaxID=81985 RepID=R0FRG7_9BRAS|nr:uncharacterized protein LOC17885205 [Capsella rubella]EOA25182.1 hypothetical protein CARUB_v10018494mg [Capsella rubella]